MDMRELQPRHWRIGAWFRFSKNPHHVVHIGFRHRIYWNPPAGDVREEHISPNVVHCDFACVYRIIGIYVSSKWLAVQFEVIDSGGWSSYVWTNVRKWNEWWAEVVDDNDMWW